MYIVKIDSVLKCFLSLLLDHSLFNLLLHWSMMGNWIFHNQNYFHSMFVSWKSWLSFQLIYYISETRTYLWCL